MTAEAESANTSDPATSVRSLLEDGEIPALWTRFRAGGIIHCADDDYQVALSVDGATRGYRFVCTHCGRSSAWFEDSLGSVFRLRSTSIPEAMDPQD